MRKDFPKVLIVEDSPVDGRLTVLHLERLGYSTLKVAPTVQQAFEEAQTGQWEIVLMDITLPGNIDGVSAAGLLFERHSLPVVFVTSRDDDEILARITEAGGYAYLRKPVDRVSLHATIQLALNRHSLAQELKQHRNHFQLLAEKLGVSLQHKTGQLEETLEKLTDSRRTLRAFVDAAPNLIALLDDHGEIKLANQGFAEEVGVPLEQLVGRKITGQASWMFDDSDLAVVREVIRSGKNMVQQPRNAGRHFRLIIFPVPRGDIDLAWAGLIVSDITSEKITEEQMRMHQEKLAALASQLNRAEEKERRRIATDLHDKVCQNLALAVMRINQYDQKQKHPDHKELLKHAFDLVKESLSDTRSLMMEISPPTLYDLGLKSALDDLAEKMAHDFGLAVEIDSPSQEPQLSDTQKSTLYQCARELLINAAKHADANLVKVVLRESPGILTVAVMDDGMGMQLVDGMPKRTSPQSFGLFNISERVGYLGGSLKIDSKPKQGACLTITVPINPSGAPLA